MEESAHGVRHLRRRDERAVEGQSVQQGVRRRRLDPGVAVVASVLVGLVVTVLAVVAPTPRASRAAGGLPSCPVGFKATDVQCNQVATAGPLGPISVFGDSVLLGS